MQEKVPALAGRAADALSEACDYTLAIALQHARPAGSDDPDTKVLATEDPDPLPSPPSAPTRPRSPSISAPPKVLAKEDPDAPVDEEAASLYMARVWHFVQGGVPPADDTPLLPQPPRAQMHTRGDSSWYATRVRSKARHLLAQACLP